MFARSFGSMLNVDRGKIIRVLILCSALLLPNAGVLAQDTKPKPKTNPTQRDATKPPGQEQNPAAPPGTQPGTQNPAAPPATQQPAPQTPPGTTAEPQQPGAARPTSQPSPVTPGDVTTTPPVTDQEPR